MPDPPRWGRSPLLPILKELLMQDCTWDYYYAAIYWPTPTAATTPLPGASLDPELASRPVLQAADAVKLIAAALPARYAVRARDEREIEVENTRTGTIFRRAWTGTVTLGSLYDGIRAWRQAGEAPP